MRYIILLCFLSFQLIVQDNISAQEKLNAQEKINVLASASMINDIAKNIVGDLGEVTSIVPIGGDPHIYEATPRDVKKVADADLVLINGLTFEGWITELIENSGTAAPTIVVTEGVDVIESGKYKNSFDPHAWMNAANGVIYARNIRDALTEKYPENRPVFEANFQTYKKKLEELDSYILQQIKTIPKNKRILVTSHDAFAYYGKKYEINVEAIMGISTEADARTSDVARVSKSIKESGIGAIFIESTVNPKLIKQLADDNGVSVGGELYADSLGDEESEASTYISMLKHNTDVIVNALAKGELQKTKLDNEDNSGGIKIFIILGIVFALMLLFAMKKMNT